LRPPIARFIQRTTSTWQPQEGACPTCALIYARRFAEQRSHDPLHTTTDPHTTFPYYHAEEETVLSQPERLADYATFGGAGVTIAFLDSGYYPHPDLARNPTWPGAERDWAALNPSTLRSTLEQGELRLVDYVDLTDGGEQTGLTQPSLWSGAGYSWHGQMTTTLAVGNGLCSQGRFRGYAPLAQVLPIKIGRSNGRIPEADILAGLQWLLRDDNWARHQVRVVNLAVGGDFPEAWRDNPVCLAAMQLSAAGVLVCAAAGNSGKPELVAPAQAPDVLTVGGYADHNRRWLIFPATERELALYPHNYGAVWHARRRLSKPEILAGARWLPAPILPPSSVMLETQMIGALRRLLLGYAEDELPTKDEPAPRRSAVTMPEVWQGLRQRMNAHKWVHPAYQHVDGTSVAVAQVSAVAAQMFAANPQLTGATAKALLLSTARPLPHHPAHLTGQGVLQPTQAVAAALRSHGGRLTGYPHGGSLFSPGELQKWLQQGKVAILDTPGQARNGDAQPVYFGYYDPQARAVSLVGLFNRWQPGHLPLHPTDIGWWHRLVWLAPGVYPYRFWVEPKAAAPPIWLPDPENQLRSESGYREDHSLMVVQV
jgi:serine protease AprX